MLNSFPPYTVHIVCISSSFFAFYIFPSVSLFFLLFLSVCMIFFRLVRWLVGWMAGVMKSAMQYFPLFASMLLAAAASFSVALSQLPRHHFDGVRSRTFFSFLSSFFLFFYFRFAICLFIFPLVRLFPSPCSSSSSSPSSFSFSFLVGCYLYFHYFSLRFFFGKSLVYKNFALGLKSYRNEQQQQQRQRHKQWEKRNAVARFSKDHKVLA